MTGLEERVAALEARLRAVEDELDVLRVVASYGPAVDAGGADAVAALWQPSGVYDVDTGVLNGRQAVAAMVEGPDHQGLLERGCAHILAPARVRVEGDVAVGVGHSLLVLRSATSEGFRVVRATAHRWELRRGADGWQVSRRTSRLLDGSPEARSLLEIDPPDS